MISPLNLIRLFVEHAIGAIGRIVDVLRIPRQSDLGVDAPCRPYKSPCRRWNEPGGAFWCRVLLVAVLVAVWPLFWRYLVRHNAKISLIVTAVFTRLIQPCATSRHSMRLLRWDS
jgi:hypothetical protein